jgi:tRNA-Thr(GGU) m(6)t(6)A37 methyltransferase TsaA
MEQHPIIFHPIGLIRTAHQSPEETPIQPIFAPDCEGRAEIFPEFQEGLQDIEHYSHIYLVYHLHRVKETRLLTKPFLQDSEHGIFATRAPFRPNPIGLSIVRLLRREANTLLFVGADILDGTPLLDIKPYSRRFDRIETERDGWQDHVDDTTAWQRGRRRYKG